jgi:hypothetical protein
LHALPERQAFDAAALAARLGLPEGEPWRLGLTARAEVAPGVAVGDAANEPLALPLAGLTLTGFEALAGPVDGARPDPLRTLFASPRGGLVPGQRVDLMYWRPRASEAQTGEPSEPAACTLRAALGDGALEVELTPTRLAESGTSASLARLPNSSREERGR